MLELLSKLDAQWFFGIIITLFLFHLKRVKSAEDLKHKENEKTLSEVKERNFKVESQVNINTLECENLQKQFSLLQRENRLLEDSVKEQVCKVESRMYKIREEILHFNETFKLEQNAILSRLDSKIENIYIFLTQHEKNK